MGPGPRAIARSLSVSPGTVSGYLGRVRVAKLTWPLPPELDEDVALERLLFADEKKPRASRPEPDWARLHLELRKKHVTKQWLVHNAHRLKLGGESIRKAESLTGGKKAAK